MNIVSADTYISQSAQFQDFERYLSGLFWASGNFEITPLSNRVTRADCDDRKSRAPWAGFLIHSLLGIGLRQVACTQLHPCPGACMDPHACVFGMLTESRPSGTGTPFAAVAHTPSPVIVDAPWKRFEDCHLLQFRIHLLGRAAQHAQMVSRGLEESLRYGVGEERRPYSLRLLKWTDQRSDNSDTSSKSLRIEFLTPVRLVRKKVPMRTVDLTDLVKDLNLRIASWGHYHQGLGWAPPWRFLMEEAAATKITHSDLRWTSFRRYSSRQQRAIPLGGLLGTLSMDNLGPGIAKLLHLSELIGIGKGASIGLGRIRINKM
jgi:hypothetical protein